MATYYIPSEAGWQANGGGTYSTYLRVKVDRTYNSSTNKSSVTLTVQIKNAVLTLTWHSNIGSHQTLIGNGNSWTLDGQYGARTTSSDTWVDVAKTGAGALSYDLQHAPDGSATISVGVDLAFYASLGSGSNVRSWQSSFVNLSGSISLSEPRASSIQSCSSAVQTTGAIALIMNRAGAFFHKATFKIGGTTLATSAAFETSLNVTVPRSWFDSYPNDTSKTVTVSVQTYTDSSCTTAVGSPVTATVTVTADPGMKPTIGSGFASVAAYNAGTAAAGISGYVQGYSRARLTLTKSSLTMANNATVASYKVTCQGASTTKNSPGATETMDTATLTGTSAVTITVTVTDSRGRTASTTLSVTPMAYAPPTLSGISVFRCDQYGNADADGMHFSVRATAACSSLGGQNSVGLQCWYKSVGGSYVGPWTPTSGVARVLGGSLSPDTSYVVLIRATDSLGNKTDTTATIPTRQWAMKFRPTGDGVGFGKAPEHSKALEIPADWDIWRGSQKDYEEYSITAGDITNSSLRVTRQGKLVSVEGWITLKAQSYVANSTVLFTLPAGARPSGNRFGWFHRADAHMHVAIGSSGQVLAGDAYTSTGTPYFFGNFTYRL